MREPSVNRPYKAEDWERSIRHGVAPSGRPLLVMPSGDYAQMSDADLAALVAHVRQLPAVDGKARVVDLPLPLRALYGVGFIKDAAATIDHTRVAPASVSVADTVDYGAYVAAMCTGCHGPALHGGRVPGGPPDWPPAPRLVKGEGSMLARYPDAQSLAAMFRSGKRPDGSAVQVMPFDSLKAMSDLEVSALYRFLSQ
jgi:mono/diheme cytochrome c family protein